MKTSFGLRGALEIINKLDDYRRVSDQKQAATISTNDGLHEDASVYSTRCLTASRDVISGTVRLELSTAPYFATFKNKRPWVLRNRVLTFQGKPAAKAGYGSKLETIPPRYHESSIEWGVHPKGRREKKPDLMQVKLFHACDTTLPAFPQGSERSDPNEDGILSPQAANTDTVFDEAMFDLELHEQLVQIAQRDTTSNAEDLGSHLAEKAFVLADAKYPHNRIGKVVVKLTSFETSNDFWKDVAEISRERSEIGHLNKARQDLVEAQGKHRAFIALGANLGDRISNIEEACRILNSRGIKVVKTSCLYETAPMYVVDQDQFINGACEVSGGPRRDTNYALLRYVESTDATKMRWYSK